MTHFVHSVSYYGGFLFGLIVIFALLLLVADTLLDLYHGAAKDNKRMSNNSLDWTDEEWEAYERRS